MLVIQRPTVEATSDEDPKLQTFAIGPLEPGFGHTIGNSIRRTLLSSIPGAAITMVRFDDALHEFGTIEGVTEDASDVILNLKDIVITSTSDEAIKLRLDVQGPADVTAADIIATADVEILNPEQHIATVNGKGRLAMDLTVERGRGYLGGNSTKRESTTIGEIPIDAIFSPVRRVAVSVEPTRVEQETDYDRLLVEIETDGSVSPREALASSGATLRVLVELIENMSEEPEGLQLTEAVVAPVSSPDLDRTIEEMDFSERPRNCLKRAQIHTLGELLAKTEDDLLAITNFGQKSLDEVLEKLDELGYSLSGRD